MFSQKGVVQNSRESHGYCVDASQTRDWLRETFVVVVVEVKSDNRRAGETIVRSHKDPMPLGAMKRLVSL